MIQVVGAIIKNTRGEVLLAQRPPGKKLAGLWEFPGGKIEEGESGETALVRELREELKLEIESEKFLGVFPHTYDWGSIALHIYVVRALNKPEPTEDVHVFKWVTPSQIQMGELAAADRMPLERYLLDSGPSAE